MGHMRGNHTLTFLSFSFSSLPLSLKIKIIKSLKSKKKINLKNLKTWNYLVYLRKLAMKCQYWEIFQEQLVFKKAKRKPWGIQQKTVSLKNKENELPTNFIEATLKTRRQWNDMFKISRKIKKKENASQYFDILLNWSSTLKIID